MSHSMLTDPLAVGALQRHMLPLLTAIDLARLTATCRDLRELVSTAGPGLWRDAAARALPWHPALPEGAKAVQAVLQQHAACCNNLANGHCTETVCSSPNTPVCEPIDSKHAASVVKQRITSS